MKFSVPDVTVSSSASLNVSPMFEGAWKLGSIARRLELICSYLNGAPQTEEFRLGVPLLDVFKRSAHEKYEPHNLQLMEYYLAAIENAISTLSIRSLNSNGLLTRDVEHGVSDVLAELSLLQADALKER
ncbi:hypothetical protein V1504DRAFT_479177 [Lipomyces starkeyi]